MLYHKIGTIDVFLKSKVIENPPINRVKKEKKYFCIQTI